MNFISVRDLRSNSAQIWKKLAREKEIVVTLNGKPVAVLSAVNEDGVEKSLALIRRARAMAAVQSMQYQSSQSGLDKISLEEINKEIASVRKARSR